MKASWQQSGYRFYWQNLIALFTDRHFQGWGRKRTGRFAVWCAKTFNGTFTLYEDGFIRSIGLGVDGAPAFAKVKDSVGIYYDATQPSELENLLNNYDFKESTGLLDSAKEAIAFIQQHNLSKYNQSPDIAPDYFPENASRILVIAQTAGDASLKYGLGNLFSTQQMIEAAISENPGAKVYVKLHPDVLAGKKQSDIDLNAVKKHCTVITDDVNPISLLKEVDKVYTKTSQMGFEALLLGKQCVCFGAPFYAGWGLTDDRVSVERRKRTLDVEEVFAAAYILYTDYVNPFTQKSADLMDALQTINRHKTQGLKQSKHAFFFGFSFWKHPMIKPFLTEVSADKWHFINPLLGGSHYKLAQKKGLDEQSVIYIWGRRSFPEVEAFAQLHKLAVYRVEDGFVRSVSLGSDLTQPYSLVVDSRGIYFDPTAPSDLEYILQNTNFQKQAGLLTRAQAVAKYLVDKKLSKYNVYDHKLFLFPDDKKVILVPGQVEDDASIKYGANGATNLSLLKAARQNCPNDWIVFKPHPDVLAGNRVGQVASDEALNYCDQIVTEVSIDSVLSQSDEVHTLTSLVGFEALMRGKKVVTYGQPFYAGWGLTIDQTANPNRTRKLSLNELVAGALLLYPRYINPKTHQPCEIETVFSGLESQQARLQNSRLLRVWTRSRNAVVRSIQALFKKRRA